MAHTGATYVNSKGTVLGKPAAVNGPLPLDHKSKYYDGDLFTYRPFLNPAEVLSYLGNQKYQGLKVWVETTGIFNSSTGIIANSSPIEWEFDGVLQLRPYIPKLVQVKFIDQQPEISYLDLPFVPLAGSIVLLYKNGTLLGDSSVAGGRISFAAGNPPSSGLDRYDVYYYPSTTAWVPSTVGAIYPLTYNTKPFYS